ncbi:YopX family protein [Streptococcus oralis subsp. tigurinus]|uniref:YopX family protein n=1 Tax=Streptococcus oralis TaxID=1303 RepID=UPI0039C06C24
MIPRFRVWLPDIDQMLRVKALVFEKDKTRCVCGYSFDFYLEDENATIMQSTGLEDDFGKEIFEGDVILWTYWDEFEESGRAKIVFDKGMFRLLDIHTEKDVWDSLFDCIENCNVYLQGNVYENSEILEEKE